MSPALKITCPASNLRRSAEKQRSFCIAGWILLKIGNCRMSSTSCSRLMTVLRQNNYDPGAEFASCGGQQLVQRAAVRFELGEGAVLGELAALHHQHHVEALGDIGPLYHPDEAAALAAREDALEHARLRGVIERRHRLVDHEKLRPLDERAYQRDLLPIGGGEARAADAHLVVETDLHRERPQAELVEQLAHERGDACRRLGLAGDDLAEEDVVLQ